MHFPSWPQALEFGPGVEAWHGRWPTLLIRLALAWADARMRFLSADDRPAFHGSLPASRSDETVKSMLRPAVML